VLDGPINAECLLAYVAQILVPVGSRSAAWIGGLRGGGREGQGARLRTQEGRRRRPLPDHLPRERIVYLRGVSTGDFQEALKLVNAAAKTWRRLHGENQLPKVVQGVKFKNGIEVPEMSAHHAA
jgi:hypothetical protein